LSIGSVGGRSDNTVDTVNILDSQIINSDNGVRIKTVSGATGKVTGVTYSNIKLTNVSPSTPQSPLISPFPNNKTNISLLLQIAKYGIVIEQDYENGSPTGTPTAGVPITGLTVKGVTGSVSSNAVPIYILCAKGACSNWTWSGNAITGGKKSAKCSNIPSPAAC
jgi:polygalacturonase